MSRLPLALVGCGVMGRRHIGGLAALDAVGLLDLDLVAVLDTDAAAAARAADLARDRLGRRPRVLASLDELLADGDIAAVDVAAAPAAHHRIVPPLLAAGRHVLCEKPLAITMRGVRAILDAAAAAPPGTVLATQEQFRRGPVNRLARSAIEAGLIGEVFLVSALFAGGDDRILLTAWRHLREHGSIALDAGVHAIDGIFHLLGATFVDVWGRGFIAEPVRRRGIARLAGPLYAEALAAGPDEVVATGEDSVIALYRMEGGPLAFLTFLPSGPGHAYTDRTIHGRGGSIVMPEDRTGLDLEVRLDGRRLGARDLLAELPVVAFDEATTRLFPSPLYAERPFADVDAAHIGLTVHDFGRAILDGRPPEVDGATGADAVAAILGAFESEAAGRPVTREEMLAGRLTAAQDDIDVAIGLA